MKTNTDIHLTQQEIENIVHKYLSQQHPEFQIQESTLESQGDGESVKSWWISCMHKNGDESIMEDDQVLLLIKQQQGWNEITQAIVREDGDKGFELIMKGK